MKVFLLYPPITKKERYSSVLGNAGGEQIPLGVFYLSAYLKNYGYDTKVLDAEAEEYTEDIVVKLISDFGADIVGISSTTVAFFRALNVAKLIKMEKQNIPIVLGGPHISSNVNHAMSFKCFDFGILHEGEQTLLELVQKLDRKKMIDFFDIQGLAHRDRGEVIVNNTREYIKDLDTLPFPDYSQIDDISLYAPAAFNYKTLPVINIITSRGCPYECTFCDRNTFGRNIRFRSAKNVFEEIKYLYDNYQVREIAFVDDTFLLKKQRIFDLFRLLDVAGIKIVWSCMSRINAVDYNFLSFIKSKGCWSISFGIESGNQKILKLIKKAIDLKSTREVISMCYKLGIKTKGFFIVGHPSETLKTIKETRDFALSVKLNDIVCTINTPIPGSPQYKDLDKYGDCERSDWSKFNYWNPVFVPFGLTKDVLLREHKKFYRSFYLRPRILLEYFFRFFGKGGLRRFIAVVKSSLFLFIRRGGKNYQKNRVSSRL